MVGGVPKVTWLPDLGAERGCRVLGAKGLLPAAAETARGTGLEAPRARRTAVRAWKRRGRDAPRYGVGDCDGGEEGGLQVLQGCG